MAKAVSERTLGVDAAKAELVIYCWQDDEIVTLSNDAASIRAWLKRLEGPVRIAIEPTSTYHLALVEQASRRGHPVYLVNPRQLCHYRESVNLRHKSDADDAWLLARFLAHEGTSLRPFCLPERRSRELWALIKRRALLVASRQQLTQSLAEVDLPHRGLLSQFKLLLARIERRIKTLITELGWEAAYRRCRSIPGIGDVNAAALVCAFNRGSFAGSDAFIAYLGLDVRRRESGAFKGRRKLSKRGEPELRRLLYCAAQPALCHARFKAYHQRQIDKGHSKIAAKLILARKLARIAFSLMSREQTFDRDIAMA